MNTSYFGPLVRRLLILSVISVIIVLGFSEFSYRLLQEDTSRGPTTIELVIPEGTSERVLSGEPVPTIPEEMIFVVGDTLLVKNDDIVDHQLGPLWIPSGSSSSLKMEQKNNYAYACSFQPTQYLGLTVKEAVTWKSRLGALGYAGLPTLMFLMVYSIVMFPLKPREDKSDESQNLETVKTQ